MPSSVESVLAARVPGIRIEPAGRHGETVLYVDPEHLHPALETCRNHPDLLYRLLSDLTVVDYLPRTPRFEVVYQLYAPTRRIRLRIKVALDGPGPELPTVTDLWKVADWLEREAWDMYGIRFTGHPDLRRLLMYEEFVGHPLRKDYPIMKMQPLIEMRMPLDEVLDHAAAEPD